MNIREFLKLIEEKHKPEDVPDNVFEEDEHCDDVWCHSPDMGDE